MQSPENSFAQAPDLVSEQPIPLPEPGGEVEDTEREDVAQLPEDKHASKLHKRLQTAKRTFQTGVVAAEANHITNEAFRYGVFAATLAETHNPALAGTALGGATLLVEGAGALAAASLLSADNRGRLVNWAMKKGGKVVPKGAKVPAAGEFGVAMVLGTPVLMGLKNIADPERTLKQNRRHGLFTASWMAALFAAEGAVLGNSVEKYNDPKMLATGAIAVGGLAVAIKYSKSLIKKVSATKQAENPASNTNPENPEERPLVADGQELTNEQIEESSRFYADYRDDNDEGVRIGLFGDDLQKALRSPRSVLLRYEGQSGDYYAPLLVPIDELEWYNTELFKRLYGEDTKLYYYTRPPTPLGADSLSAAASFLKDKLDDGAVIVTDWYDPAPEDGLLAELQEMEENRLVFEDINSGEIQRKADVFAGPVIFEGVTDIKEARSIVDVYKEGVASGQFEVNPSNGVALQETIEGDEAERIWEVYEAPFDKLSEGDPIYAGFDKETLMDIMRDREVAKIVNRVEGKITSLCFFVEDFKNCPWFNPKYYEKNFPEYYNTNNILIFPGIVSDEQMKGSSYSGLLIDLATRICAKRQSNLLVTFECTEISTRYIPRIVARVINNTGVGTVSGLEHPLSTIRYSVLRKSNAPA